jgi:exopolyphosphatase/guanosine-5'-triphosphate,3'-diphosphate pyrophosphatase
MRVCTIDVGTNSVRGLVADVDESGEVHVVQREGHITRLGQHLSRFGFLSEQAIERTAEAVEGIVAKARSLNTDRFKIVATSAARDAINSDKLREQIRERSSLETKIISGVEEARYVCEGVLSCLEVAGNRLLMADVGGGSTEMISFCRGKEPVVRSVGVGAVEITEQFLHHDLPLAVEISRAREHATTALGHTFSELPSGAEELIGLGGTITTIPPILMEMERYDPSRVHNYLVTSGQVESVLDRLASMPLADRMDVKGLEPARADIIVGGLLIVEALMEVTRFRSIRVSDRGILFGLALSVVSGKAQSAGEGEVLLSED